MNNDKNVIAVSVIVLLIGLGIGFIFGSNTKSVNDAYMIQEGGANHGHQSMESMMHDMELMLSDKTGSDFDKAFLEEMIVHHEGAIVMAQMVLERSSRPELLRLANEIITAQSSEITMMQAWRDAWFGHAEQMAPPAERSPSASQNPPISNGSNGDMVACTMDAKICPDGSAVGRQGPYCEFAPCPGE